MAEEKERDKNNWLQLAKNGKTAYKIGSKVASAWGGSSSLAGTGLYEATSPTWMSATGGTQMGSVSAAGTSMAAIGGGLAFGAWVGSKILEGFTNDHPHLNFMGNNIKYQASTGGTEKDGTSYKTATGMTPNHGGIPSKAGFEYAISSKDFEGALEASTALRDYLDEAFTHMKSQTDVDLNQIIPYAFDGASMSKGENPQDFANRVIKNVATSIKSGSPYDGKDGQYITGTEKRNTFDDETAKIQEGIDSGKYIGRDAEGMQERLDGMGSLRDSSGKDYNAPVYGNAPSFEGDKNFNVSSYNMKNLESTLGKEGSGGNVNINKTMKNLSNLNTDIEYQHTLAELSGIKLSDQEMELLNAQKEIAIDRAISEIEDTFSFEGESMVAQQIQNLGTNALGGTIGKEFVKRWQGREAAAKTGALQDIESSYLGAQMSMLSEKKGQQVDIWGKQYTADRDTIGFGLDKYKTEGSLGLGWEELKSREKQAKLDRDVAARLGERNMDAWEDSNKWGLAGNIAGAAIGSDWFSNSTSASNAISSGWDWLTS